MLQLIFLGVIAGSGIAAIFGVRLILAIKAQKGQSAAEQKPVPIAATALSPYRNDQMKRIADVFGLSFTDHFPFNWKTFIGSSFSTKIGRQVNEMAGTINGHSVLIRESWYSPGRDGVIRTYMEIDGKGETYTWDDGMQWAIPLNELWKRLRNLAGPNTNIPESWQSSQTTTTMRRMKRSDIVKIILGLLLFFALSIYFIIQGRYCSLPGWDLFGSGVQGRADCL